MDVRREFLNAKTLSEIIIKPSQFEEYNSYASSSVCSASSAGCMTMKEQLKRTKRDAEPPPFHPQPTIRTTTLNHHGKGGGWVVIWLVGTRRESMEIISLNYPKTEVLTVVGGTEVLYLKRSHWDNYPDSQRRECHIKPGGRFNAHLQSLHRLHKTD